jgi:hypothetical protein
MAGDCSELTGLGSSDGVALSETVLPQITMIAGYYRAFPS